MPEIKTMGTAVKKSRKRLPYHTGSKTVRCFIIALMKHYNIVLNILLLSIDNKAIASDHKTNSVMSPNSCEAYFITFKTTAVGTSTARV